MKKTKLNPVHPGEVLLEEFLKPMRRRINEIVLEKRKITADTALRLARFFGTSSEFWLSLQAHRMIGYGEYHS